MPEGDGREVVSTGLMVRSAPKERVSNHGAAPSFETGAELVIGPRFARTRWRPPQDEAEKSCGVWVLAFAGTTEKQPYACEMNFVFR